MAFLPTYFAAEDSRQKAGLLAMLLLISGTLTILCLFAPKVFLYILNELTCIAFITIKTFNIYHTCYIYLNNLYNIYIFMYQIYATIYMDELELHTNKIGTSFSAAPSSMTMSTT